MKGRVDIFRATFVVGKRPEDFTTSPACAAPWCRWVVVDSMAYAARQGPRSSLPVGKQLRRLALPPLPSEGNHTLVGLSDGMRSKIEDKREQAAALKRQKNKDTSIEHNRQQAIATKRRKTGGKGENADALVAPPPLPSQSGASLQRAFDEMDDNPFGLSCDLDEQ